jgi:hypothetical protein
MNTVSVRNQNLHFLTKYGLFTVKNFFAIIFRNVHSNCRISDSNLHFLVCFIRLRKPNTTQLFYIMFDLIKIIKYFSHNS